MILQIRTKDNLEELLKQGNSPAWVIAESRVPEIQSVEIYQFDGKRVLKADFDATNSTRTEFDRLVVAFKNGVIEDADMDWNGQNPVRYKDEVKPKAEQTLNDKKDVIHDKLTKEQSEFLESKSWRERDEASVEWFNSRAFIFEAVKKDGRWLESASKNFKDDIEIVSAAVAQSGSALEYAGTEMKKNREVVIIAVSEDGFALEYADDSLKSDYEVVKTAISNRGGSLRHAADELKKNKEIAIIAVAQYGKALEFTDDTLKADPEVVKKAISEDGSALEYASADIRKNKEIVIAAVSQYGHALEYAEDSLKSDPEVVKKAIANDFHAFELVHNDLKENLAFAIELLAFIDKENYKDYFFKLPSSVRFDKKILELISAEYPNAQHWSDAGNSRLFLDYLAYFDEQNPYENEDNLFDFTDDYGIALSEKHFEALKNDCTILLFEIENSNYAWEELGGEENFKIIYDLKENRILPYKKESPDSDDQGVIRKYQYLGSSHVGLWEPYHDDQKYDGCFSVSNYFEDKNDASFSINFESGSVDDYSCKPEILEKVKEVIKPHELYLFISDVLRHF